MNRAEHTILVTGITGHQGGAVAKHLLCDGWQVRALVRDPDKPAAQRAAATGIELVVGDLRDRASVDAAVAGVYGIHSVQSLADGPEAEQTEGRNLADAAKAAGVQHFVYSSVVGADRPSPLPWVAGKVQLEAYLRSLDMPFTIFRPTTFLESLLLQKEGILGGKLSLPEPPEVSHQRIAVDDIGKFVVLAFFDPATWLGTTTEIAGDESTGPEAAAGLSMALGVPITYEPAEPPAWMPAPEPPSAGQPAPNRADIPKLRESIPELMTLVAWASDLHAQGIW